MDTASLTAQDSDATRRAMEYWIDKWDWECPSLFGVEVEELKSVAALWPAVETGTEVVAAMCASSVWRELLYGASAARPDTVSSITGVTHERAEQVSAKIQFLAQSVMANSRTAAAGEA